MFAPKKPRVIPTLEELVASCVDDISVNWERFALNNRLNDFFLSSVPLHSMPSVNYLADLNSIASVEHRIHLSVILNAPGTSESSKLGWIAGFEIQGTKVETPVMMCEAYARCFNVLLYLKLNRELVNNDLI